MFANLLPTSCSPNLPPPSQRHSISKKTENPPTPTHPCLFLSGMCFFGRYKSFFGILKTKGLFFGTPKFFLGFKSFFGDPKAAATAQRGLINCRIVIDILEGQKRQGCVFTKAAPTAANRKNGSKSSTNSSKSSANNRNGSSKQQ